MEVPLSMSDEIHVSRFWAIPKKRQPGRWRLIVDLSSPSECTSIDTFSVICISRGCGGLRPGGLSGSSILAVRDCIEY